jgi:hypothetical protein
MAIAFHWTKSSNSAGVARDASAESRPLAGWRKTIERYSSEAQTQQGQSIRLVYFCPLNSNNNHFTLLEINEQQRKIYHYDSMVKKDVIDGTVKQTRVGKLVQVS